MLDCPTVVLAELTAPMLQGADATKAAPQNPSSMELALIGVGAIALYALAKHVLLPAPTRAAITDQDNAAPAYDRHVDEPTRGAA